MQAGIPGARERFAQKCLFRNSVSCSGGDLHIKLECSQVKFNSKSFIKGWWQGWKKAFYGRCPLNVNVSSGSLNVNDNWDPENAHGDLGASVEIVPK